MYCVNTYVNLADNSHGVLIALNLARNSFKLVPDTQLHLPSVCGHRSTNEPHITEGALIIRHSEKNVSEM